MVVYHMRQFLECMVVYNMSKYAQMCEEPCLRKCYHIWTATTYLHVGLATRATIFEKRGV